MNFIKKTFVVDNYNRLQAVEKEQISQFQQIELTALLKAGKDKGKLKVAVIELIKKIESFVAYDLANRDFNFGNVQLKHFSPLAPEEEASFIYVYNYGQILGQILYSYAFSSGYSCGLVSEGKNGAINSGEVCNSAYSEFNGHLLKTREYLQESGELKIADDMTFGATMLFAALIESELRKATEEHIRQRQVKELKKLSNLSQYDIELLDYLENRLVASRENDFQNFSVTALYSGVIDFCQRYSITINPAEEKYMKRDPLLTLGKTINSSIFAQFVEPQFVTFFKALFCTKKMNLRNNLMHFPTGNFNYHNPCITALLAATFYFIVKEIYKK